METIYVRVLKQQIETWAPVSATCLRGNIFQVMEPQYPGWPLEYPPGTKVVCYITQFVDVEDWEALAAWDSVPDDWTGEDCASMYEEERSW